MTKTNATPAASIDTTHQIDFAPGGYTIHTNTKTGCGCIIRFAGSPGEHYAADFGPDCHFKTSAAFLAYQDQQDREQAAAERRCPQM